MKQKDDFALFYAGWPIAFIAKQPMAAEQTTRRRLALPVQVNAEFDPSKKKHITNMRDHTASTTTGYISFSSVIRVESESSWTASSITKGPRLLCRRRGLAEVVFDG